MTLYGFLFLTSSRADKITRDLSMHWTHPPNAAYVSCAGGAVEFRESACTDLLKAFLILEEKELGERQSSIGRELHPIGNHSHNMGLLL